MSKLVRLEATIKAVYEKEIGEGESADDVIKELEAGWTSDDPVVLGKLLKEAGLEVTGIEEGDVGGRK